MYMSIWMNPTILLLYTIHFYLYYFQSISLASCAAINQLIYIFFTPHSIRFSFGRLFHLNLPFELIWIILYLEFFNVHSFLYRARTWAPKIVYIQIVFFFQLNRHMKNSLRSSKFERKRERKKWHILDAFCLNLFRNFCSSSVKSDDETRNSQE